MNKGLIFMIKLGHTTCAFSGHIKHMESTAAIKVSAVSSSGLN